MSRNHLTGRVIRPSPTAACRIGNEPVRSLRDKVAREQNVQEEAPAREFPTTRRITGHGSEDGVLWKTKVNCRVNRRYVETALICDIGFAKRQVEGMTSWLLSHSITVFLPAARQFLRHSQTALTRNLVSLYFRCNHSRPTARKADGSAGRGNLKKRMPSCNGADRGKAENVVTANKADALTRKGADFR